MDRSSGASLRHASSGTRVLAICAAVAWLASAFYLWHFGGSWHLDLRVYRGAGHALLHHGSPFRSVFTANKLPFTYPPFALLLLAPLSLGTLGFIEGAWWLASSAALVVTLYLLMPARVAGAGISRPRRWAIAAVLGAVATIALEPVRSNMDYGQINLFLMLLVVVDLRQLRPRFGGLAIGLAAAVKLTPIVYLLYFAVRRDWRSVTHGVASFGVWTGLAWLVLPGDSSLYWLHEATDAARTGPVGAVSNQSWNGMVHRSPFLGHGGGTVLWLALSVVTAALGVFVAARLASDHRPMVESVLILALVELLISPISWSHHWSWLAAAPIAAASLASERRWIAALLWVAVITGITVPYLWGVRWGPARFATGNSLVLVGMVILTASAASFRCRSPVSSATADP